MKPGTLIIRLVNQYIGVSGGYLGLPAPFTYRTHAEFYPEYCDLSKDTSTYPSLTTRQAFIAIFMASTPKEQAKIIRGAIERFPVGSEPPTRTEALKAFFLTEANKLEKLGDIADPEITYTSDVVFEALDDASSLVRERRAVSAVDRVHTAFHGYLRSICTQAGITFTKSEDLVVLVKKIFANHPRFQALVRGGDIGNIAKSLASISSALNPIRNRGSLAHPNESLLAEPEAMLVINAVKTLMTYLEARLLK
jgi:hypothetical protein